jgi:hypothetical protein
METNSKKILAALPDWEDFMALAEEIKKLYVYRMGLENKIKSIESENFRRVMSENLFFVNGKPVPVSYYENAYKHSGIDNNLVAVREELAETVAMLEQKRNIFEIYNRMLEMHKTIVYQEKVTL